MIDIYALGLKGGLILAAMIVAAYLLFTWLRLRQIKRRKAKAKALAAARQKAAAPQAPAPAPVAMTEDDDEALDAVIYTRPRPAVPPPMAPAADPGFATLLGENRERQQPVRSSEVQALRDEVAMLRNALADMQEEMDRLKAAQTVSPLYNEAVGLAQHGIDAEGIAARCGISIAEAQLVAALASRQGADERLPDDPYGNDYGTDEPHGRPGKRYAA
ncbi:hypothetical protein DLREEDagrD3_03600 [Denitratisoma sp. agr-D3]